MCVCGIFTQPMIYHGILSWFRSELNRLTYSTKVCFLYRWAASNTPIEKRFFATLFENMERVASIQGDVKKLD